MFKSYGNYRLYSQSKCKKVFILTSLGLIAIFFQIISDPLHAACASCGTSSSDSNYSYSDTSSVGSPYYTSYSTTAYTNYPYARYTNYPNPRYPNYRDCADYPGMGLAVGYGINATMRGYSANLLL